jgi:RHS repeat-associated protein
VAAGANSIPLVATDANGKTTTKTLTGTVSGGAARSLMYDANGDLTSDGAGNAYAYDAANRLISVTNGNNVTGYVYDGYGRRVQETSNGAVAKQWVWCPGMARPCEERDGSNKVTKRFYNQGEQINSTNYYFTKDHQGSIREMTNAGGALVARYDYDPYGRRSLVSGTDLADFGFTGFWYDQATGLDFSRTRPYIADLGRWLNRDLYGEDGGLNLYAYVLNNPINLIDPFGLWVGAGSRPGGPGLGARIGGWLGGGLGFIASLPTDFFEDVGTGGVGVLANPATTIAMTGGGAAGGAAIGNAIDGLFNSMSGTPSAGNSNFGKMPQGDNTGVNPKANDAAKEAGLDCDQMEIFHDELEPGMSYQQMLNLAREIKAGNIH